MRLVQNILEVVIGIEIGIVVDVVQRVLRILRFVLVGLQFDDGLVLDMVIVFVQLLLGLVLLVFIGELLI